MDMFVNATHFGSDGSGGRHSSDPRIRVCGAGAADATLCNGVNNVFGGLKLSARGAQTVPRAELTAISACSKLEFEPPRLAVGWKVVDMTAAGGVAPNIGELRASNAAVGRVGEINDDGTYQVNFPALPGARADAPTTVVRTLRMSDIEACNEGHNGIWPFVVSAQLSGQQQDGGPRALVMKFATRTEAERSAWLSVLLA